MMRSHLFLALLLALTVGALLFRLPALGNRPIHEDEAVHAAKFRILWEQGVYKYDPNEFHGPTIYYAALPSVRLQGRQSFLDTREADYRLPIALFGAMMVLLLALLADGLGRRAALWAGLFTAVSPAMVFYSRYFIQEIPFAFFTLGVLACGWRYVKSQRPGWLIGAGVCAGLMIASKETAVLTFVAIGVAVGLTALWTRRLDGSGLDLRRLWNGKLVVIAAIVALATASLFISGFFSNPVGPLDYLRSYGPWLGRAHGVNDIHDHAWNYYLSLLLWTHRGKGPVWSEGLIVGLALVGIITALMPRAKSHLHHSVALARFLAFYTLTLTALYSAIPYKTPWCLLSFLNGLILLAGLGAMALIRLTPHKYLKPVVVLALLAGCAQLAFQSYQTSFVYESDPLNPYVYAQTDADAASIQRRVEDLARTYKDHDQMAIEVISTDRYYWPLPWYLRRFPNKGFWINQMPSDVNAPVVLASPEFDEELSKKLNDTHLMNGIIKIRTDTFFELWIRMDVWQAHLDAKKKAQKEEPN